MFVMVVSCLHCTGDKLCPKHRVLNQFYAVAPKVKLHFKGPSPPDIFVGRHGYPNVNMGVLATPVFDSRHGDLKSAEDWSRENLGIANVLRLRGSMIYGRSSGNIRQMGRIRGVMSELALTDRMVNSEVFLKKVPLIGELNASSVFRPMTNPAPLRKVLLEDNVVVKRQVDSLVSDTDVLANDAIRELSSHVRFDHLQKLLSAGMLGREANRKMVPTRWSITAVDDLRAKDLLHEVRCNSELDVIRVFVGSYVGNYICILMLPGMFSFEGIEVWEDEVLGDGSGEAVFAHDYEGFGGRKGYATNVTGGYYAMRLPCVEYLHRLGLQAGVLVFREITTEYYAPLGVGVVREATKRALASEPIEFDSREDAVAFIRSVQKLRHDYVEKSWLLREYGKQKTLGSWF